MNGNNGPVAEAIENGVLGERVWFYANYHCNLECTYCLTDSSPSAPRRQIDPIDMVAMADEAKALGFRAIGVTGGEPFLLAHMPDTVAALAAVLPTVVLTNATLFSGSRLDRVAARLQDLPVQLQVSLDAPDPVANDTKRGADNFADVTRAIPRMIERGLRVRVATTVDPAVGLTAEEHERLCELHRSWGISDDDHVVRPIVARGRAVDHHDGARATYTDFSAELCITADGAFWSAFGPTVRNGRLDTDLLVTRTTRPLRVPAQAMLRIAEGRPPGADASLGIR